MARRFPRPSSRPPRPHRARLRLEPLEDRSLLDAGTQLLVTLTTGQIRVVTVPAATNVATALADWQSRPGVRSAEVNQTLTVSMVPNDGRFVEQWSLNNTGQSGGKVDADIDAPEAWNTWTGGTNKAVAVLDTGIDYTHPDLYKNIWINQQEIPLSIRANLTDTDDDGLFTFWDLNDPVNVGPGKITDLNGNGYIDAGDILKPASQGGWANGISDDGDTAHVDDLIGWDFLNNDNDPFDDNGHGTHVAGTIGALGNNGLGVSGVNWKAQMAALKFLGTSGSGSLDLAVSALRYAVANGIPISNNSWGGATYSQALYDAISEAALAGHVFVAAAGNAGSNNDRAPNYPASFGLPNIVSVGATTRMDTIAPFSNYGLTSVDLAAPGQQLLSTVPGGRYAPNSGTSAAAPQVAGAVALIWSRNPGMSYSDVLTTIFSTVQKLPTLKGRMVTGGRLDLGKALDLADPGPEDSTGAYVLNVTQDGTYTVSGLRVTFSSAIVPGSITADDIRLLDTGGGAIAVTGVRVVPGSGNTQFDVAFATQPTPGQYAIRLGPDVRDEAGNPMNQNGNDVNGEADDYYAGTFTVSSRPPGPPMPRPGMKILAVIPDGTTTVSSLRVTFSGVMDPSTFTPSDVTLTSPNFTAIVVTAIRPVVGSSNTKFDILFAPQTTAGNYSVQITPDIRDEAGNALDQNGNGMNADPGDLYRSSFAVASTGRVTLTNDTRLAIKDFKATATTIYVRQSLTIADVDVKLNITHAYDGNLVVYVRAPNGKITTLVTYRGSSGKNFTNTILDDEASTSIAQGGAPFTGSFRPESPLSAYDGMNAAGYWTLFVYDNGLGNVGTIDSWTLSIEAGAFGGKLSLDSEGAFAATAPTSGGGGSRTAAATSLEASSLGALAAWLATERRGPATETPAERRDQVRQVVFQVGETRRPDSTSETPRTRKRQTRAEPFDTQELW